MKKASESRVKRLFNGDYVKVRGVSPALIDRVQANIKEPKAPIVLMSSGEELPNYQDPEYQEKLREVEEKRSVAALNAVILFGLELCDEEGNPIEPVTDRRWEKSLKRMGIDWEREMLDMQGVDEWEDDEDREWAKADAYMLFTAFSGHKSDLDLIRSISGADIAAQAAAEAQFPG
jgi:hypothetical protein